MKNSVKREALAVLLIAGLTLSLASCASSIRPEDARSVAKEAYIYGYRMVMSYGIQYVYFVDRANPEYKAPWNQIHSIPRVYTPDDKTIPTPKGVTKGVRSETEFVLAAYRTQLFNPADLETLQKRVAAKEVTSGDMFGTREHLKNNYLYRMGAAVLGIYGNSKQEAMYPIYGVDASGEKPDGTTHRYVVRFPAGGLPPVNAFWSLTMYELPASLLVAGRIAFARSLQ